VAHGGLRAKVSDELGVAANVGAAYLWLHGGVLNDVRRTLRSPASSGPVEVTDELRDPHRADIQEDG